MSQLIYAGIGSRETPKPICSTMELIAAMLATKGWRLRSGRAVRAIDADPDTDSADLAFERGCDSVQGLKTIRVPSKGGLGPDGDRPWLQHAARYHPEWDKCSEYARACHARNSAIVLGDGLNDPVRFVACWTPGGAIVGGTGQALRIAADPAYNIPVFNMFWPQHIDALWKYIASV